jgi:hypothetical protein
MLNEQIAGGQSENRLMVPIAGGGINELIGVGQRYLRYGQKE